MLIEIISEYLDSLFDSIFSPMQYPMGIKTILNIKDDMEVRKMFKPVMLAPIPKPILFKHRTIPRIIASLESIVFELFVSIISGFLSAFS